MSKKGKTSKNDFLNILEDSEDSSSDSSLLWRSKETKSKPKTKLRQNLGQSADKPKTKLRQNLGQSADKPKTKSASGFVQKAKPKTQPKTKLRQNLGQSADKPKTKLDFSQLVGLQRKLLILLFDSCQINGSTETSKITIEALFLKLGNPKSSIQKTLQRIEQKGLITRKSFKNGRGGWTIYQFEKSVYQQVLQNETQDKLRTNLRQSADKPKSQPKTQPKTSLHSSSEIKNLRSTTTIDGVDNFLIKHNILIPEDLKKIGFGQSHLNQILKISSLSVNEVQESLEHYSLDLRNGSVRAGFGKLNLIVGVLKKSNQYVSETYIAEEQKMLDELAKRSQKFNELKKKQAEIAILKKYKAWKANLTQLEINEFVPPSNIVKEGSTLQDIQLQSYYQDSLAELIDDKNEELVK